MRKPDTPLDDEQPRPEESFLQRFNRRKLEARGLISTSESQVEGHTDATDAAVDGTAADTLPELTDADMPPLDSLTEESDYSGFLSAKVSDSLRRAALRKLFHSSTFNVIDELDDYAEDFTAFEALGDLVTAEMRHRLDVEEKRKAERVKQDIAEQRTTEADDDAESPESGINEPGATEIAESTAAETDSAVVGSPVSTTPETDTHAERSADT